MIRYLFIATFYLMNRDPLPEYKCRFAVNLHDHSITVKRFDHTMSRHKDKKQKETKTVKQKPEVKETRDV